MMSDSEQKVLNQLASHARLVEKRDIPDVFRLLVGLGCTSRSANEAIASIPGVEDLFEEFVAACAEGRPALS